MKKRNFIITLLAVVLTFGMASCNKIEKTIIGTWEASNVKMINEVYSDVFNGSIWKFNDDKSITIMGVEGFALLGTYKIDGEKLTIDLNPYLGVKLSYDLDVTENSKTNLSLAGTATLIFYEENHTETVAGAITLTLTKK